jgi:hypothetical protein
LFKQDKREDPVREKARREFLEGVVKQLSEDRGLFEQLSKKIAVGESFSLTAQDKAAAELDSEDFRSILIEAVKLVPKRASGEARRSGKDG